MLNFPVIPNTSSITDLRYKTPDILRLIKKRKQPVFVTRGSKTEAVLVAPEVFKSLWQLYEDWRDARLLEKAVDTSKELVDFEEFDKEQRKKLGA